MTSPLHIMSRQFIASAMIFALVGSSVRADDTEIFLATPPPTTATQPNILFVIDTSGSMGTNVVTQVPYDPAVTYAGNCPAGRVYWRTDSNTPNCGGSSPSTQWVTDSNFKCQSAQAALDLYGYKTQGPAAQWDGTSNNVNKRKWKSLTAGRDAYVDCKEDAAIPHGDGTANGLYPANASNGPFNADTAQQITWSSSDGADKTYTFFTSNWINWKRNASTTSQTRLQIVQDVAKRTIDNVSDVNVGLMRYSTNGQGGYVLYPVTAVSTARSALKTEIDNLAANGVTPLSETMFEAYRYWAGGKVKYGASSSPANSVSGSRLVGDTSSYKSPIGAACQKNFIVYLTDGEPNQDKDADALTQTLIGKTCTENGADGTGDGAVGDGRCFDDLAEYMYNNDFVKTNVTNEPKENVVTYTIGFGTGVTQRGIDLLKSAAALGGGQFFFANDTAELSEVFENIIQRILTDNVSFTAPAVSVNAFNRTQNLNDLFITVFAPAESYHWPGNLKKYRLDQTGVIKDADNEEAVDETKGFFKDTARSYWSASEDGPNVAAGGAAHRQPVPASRKLYTDLAALSASPTLSLTNALNQVSTANVTTNGGLIDPEDLGLPATATTAERDTLIEWARGADVDDEDKDSNVSEARFAMGDPLHARPVSIIYGGSTSSPDINDAVVYSATNDGYLHAIDPSTGDELWAFMPSELMLRLKDLRDDAASSVKRYGLDGNIRGFKLDKNNDGIVDSSAGDRVYLFFGMGRGGNNYYALDVTSKTAPKFMWRRGAADTLIGLGQTWSTPVITKVNVAGASQNSEKLVAIFGGGYDPTQDAVAYNTDDTGNRVFMVDAVTGTLLWHAGPSSGFGYDSTAALKLLKLNHSIPAEVRVLDLTNDGFADRLYVTDTGARIWRFDIFNGQPRASLVTGGVLASLGMADGGGTSPQDARRFYNAPDVAMLKTPGGVTFLNIAVGSGYRGHPLNLEIRDRFYSVRDYTVFASKDQAAHDSFTAVTDTTLADLTTNVTPTLATYAKGWKIEFSQPTWHGEKVLAEARTFAGVLLFPTFTPTSSNVNTCTAGGGKNLLYAVSAIDARPAFDRDSDATTETSDRAGGLDQSGIASEVTILFPSPDNPGTCTGAECSPPPVCKVGVESCGVTFSNDPVKTFWWQKDVD